MCDADDFDGEEVDRRWQRARKPHRCGACRETIPAGHRYHVVLTAIDGSMDTFRHCARCWQICEALWAQGAQAVQYDLNCGADWCELFGELPEPLAKLAFVTPAEAQQSLTPPD